MKLNHVINSLHITHQHIYVYISMNINIKKYIYIKPKILRSRFKKKTNHIRIEEQFRIESTV